MSKFNTFKAYVNWVFRGSRYFGFSVEVGTPGSRYIAPGRFVRGLQYIAQYFSESSRMRRRMKRNRKAFERHEQRKIKDVLHEVGWSGDFESFKTAFHGPTKPKYYQFSDEQMGCVRADGTTYPLSNPDSTYNVGCMHQVPGQRGELVIKVEHPETGKVFDKVIPLPAYEADPKPARKPIQ